MRRALLTLLCLLSIASVALGQVRVTMTPIAENVAPVDVIVEALNVPATATNVVFLCDGVVPGTPVTAAPFRITLPAVPVGSHSCLVDVEQTVKQTTTAESASLVIAQPVQKFSASKTLVDPGQPSVLSFFYPSSNVHSIKVNGALRPTYATGQTSVSGSLTVNPTTRTTYTLTACESLPTGCRPYPSMSVIVDVVALPPPPESPPPTPTPTPTPVPIPTGGLVQKSSLTLVGSFNLPRGQQAGSCGELGRFGYMTVPGGAVQYVPETGTLRMGGHAWGACVAEVRIPELRDIKTQPLLVAQMAVPFHEPTEGKYAAIGPLGGGAYRLQGTFRVGNTCLSNASVYYDAPGAQPYSAYRMSCDPNVTGEVVGPVKIGNLRTGYTSGYMAPVPPMWQAALGGPVITGNAGLSIIFRTSSGPCAFSFDPENIGKVDPVPANPLVCYPVEFPLDGNSYENGRVSQYFNGTSQINGAVIVDGTASLLFFGMHGLGPFCYGKDCGQDPAGGWSPEAPPYSAYAWAYDLNQIAACRKSTTCTFWSLKPYAVWAFDLPIPPVGGMEAARAAGYFDIAGVGYDPVRQWIFLPQVIMEQVTVHVYKVNVAPVP